MSGDGDVASVTITMAYQFFRRDPAIRGTVNTIGKLAGAVIG